MIIRDLEHYVIGSQANYIEQIRGGLATAVATLDTVASGPQGASTQGYVSIFAFSVPGTSIANSYSYATAQTY